MSQFEFLPLVTIGQYFATGSPLHRMDARAKLAVFTGLILALTFTPSIIGLVLGIFILLIGIVIAKVPLHYALKGLLAPLPFLIFIALLQIFFFSSQLKTIVYFDWGPIHITLAGLWAALQLMLRFTALILCLSLMSFCLSTSELITGLDHLLSPLNKIGIKTMDFVMVIQVAMRFLPLLAQSAERIAKAQASRGAEWGVKSGGLAAQVKRVIPLIVPLFITSLRRAETLALAMDARAYGVKDKRTSLYEHKFLWKDFWFVLFGVGMISLIVLLK